MEETVVTILLTVVILTAFYIALAVVGLVYLGRRLRGRPQLAKAIVIILMGGTEKSVVAAAASNANEGGEGSKEVLS